jgi:HAMP domain-containing protein
MYELLTSSGIALAVMAVVTVALGWPVAGRILRPLRTMTTATQRITELNLHERLVLPGPSDEVKDLAVPGPSALFQVRNSSGAWNQWPDGQRIFTHSMGPLVERMVNQSLTSAGRPHR